MVNRFKIYKYYVLLLVSTGCATITNKSAEVTPKAGAPASEPASFWAALANDRTYSIEIRRTCIFELFHRHIRRGMSLGEIADCLNKPEWLPQEWIHAKKAWSGYMPVEPVPGDSIFEIAILPSGQRKGHYVCLRVSGHVSDEEMGAALRGEPRGASAQPAKLHEIGFVE